MPSVTVNSLRITELKNRLYQVGLLARHQLQTLIIVVFLLWHNEEQEGQRYHDWGIVENDDQVQHGDISLKVANKLTVNCWYIVDEYHNSIYRCNPIF